LGEEWTVHRFLEAAEYLLRYSPLALRAVCDVRTGSFCRLGAMLSAASSTFTTRFRVPRFAARRRFVRQ
jgi:hypothetical protein